ncbi:PAS domain S-box protein [Bacillus sp. CGMCC 1.16607]|uniref:PAS domain-containing sensor histidine kinase n=1 Tax=Bacillus sp. CGMCC 1.16607 TaxID=3351842 RepID=UPI0036262DC0
MTINFPIFGDVNESLHPDEIIDLFLNCTPDGMTIVDLENRFIRINHMYTKLFGYTEEDVIGRRFNEFPNPKTVIDIIEQVKNGQSFINLISKRNHKNGTELDIAVSYSPFRNSSGEIIAIIAVYRDITASKTLERELNKTRELYKLITENTTDMIKLISKDGKILYASPSYTNVKGINAEELIGRDEIELFLPEEIESYKRITQKLFETGEPQIFQKKLITADNKIIYAEYNMTPIYNDQNEIESFVSVGRDITERVRNDAALRNLDRLSIVGQLAAGVAHEIRNPLTSLKGFSKLMRNMKDNVKQKEYLSIITNELDRIDMIVNEFMSLAKPQAIQFERENLQSIIESTITILHPQALLHNVQIKFDFQDAIELLCSPHQLKQVFVNILKNAIESMPNGGNVSIYVQKLENTRVEINFTDEGVGIETELMQYLGTPFYTSKDRGIGLGLTVSNKIIQEHNGTMKIESVIGKGTTVRVDLECL